MNVNNEAAVSPQKGWMGNVDQGQILRISGRSVIDFNAFKREDIREYFDTARTRIYNLNMYPTAGHRLFSKQNNPMMPLAWMREYAGDTGKNSRVFCTTMGASVDFQSAGLRRLFANACYWCLEMEQHILQSANVDYVDPYRPSFFGFGAYQKGLKPADFALGK